ncbi:MAG: hypothetical protein GC179_24955 [Anaerolineaceae bacterium]|nr:hypothetical protein [Anaerolineaceae bacterium]
MTDANHLLMQTYGFTADDLETNRRAQLTPAQQKIIDVGQDFIRTTADQYDKTPNRTLIWFVLMLVIPIALIALFLRDSLTQAVAQLGSSALPIAAVVVLLLILFLWYAQRSAKASLEMFRAMGDPNVNKPTVHAIEGRVELVKEEARTNAGHRDLLDRGRVYQTYFYARVRSSYETLKISIPEKDRNPFEPQRTYRIFYVEHWGTRTFLTAESVH